MNWLNPLSGIQRAIGIGMAVALLIAAGLAWRADSLRSHWKSQAEGITVTIREVSGLEELEVEDASQAVRNLGESRDRAQRERDGAKDVMVRQGESIRVYRAESERLRQLSTEQRAEIVRLSQQRNEWIAKAQAASTRTERLAAEAEVKICEQVMDDLYEAGF